MSKDARGIYKAKIIQKAENQMWFNNRRDEGAKHPELFGPIFPKPAFALVLSAVCRIKLSRCRYSNTCID